MIVTVTLNPSVDKVYWVDSLPMCDTTQEVFLTRAKRSATSAGGKGVNMSVFFSQMGLENVAMGFVGGHTGHVVVRDLRDREVTTNFVWTREETRTNVTVLERRGETVVPMLINEPGPTISPSDLDRLIRRYRRMLHRAEWVVLAGSLPQGVDDGIYARLTEMAHDAGVRVILSAYGDALERGICAHPYIVKPDTREHRVLMGVELSSREAIIEAGRKVVGSGAGMAIISHEVTGDIVVAEEAAWEITTSVSTRQFRNVVGADDIFLAGIVYKLVRGESVENALRYGFAAGIASAECDERVCSNAEQIQEELTRAAVKRIEREGE